MRDKSETILVTGCSSGIGLHAALELSKQGFNVIATIRDTNVPEELEKSDCVVTQCDMGDEKSVQGLVDSVKKGKADLYGIVNNAGYGQMGMLEDVSREALDRQFQVNVFGWHQLTAGLVGIMKKRGKGRIVFVSSVLGFVAMDKRGAYNSSKFATEGLADTWRMELNGTGVKVSLVEPGPIATKFKINAYHNFKKTVNYKTGDNKEMYSGMLERLSGDKRAPFTLDCDSTTKAIVHAMGSNPKIRYLVTFPTKLFYYLKKILPTSVMDKLLIYATKKG